MGTATAWAEIDGVAPGLSIAATASFTPTDITDLFMWFDASNAASITSSGSPAKVSQWNDLSGNSRHLVQATSAKQPYTGTQTQNALNAIEFDQARATTMTWALADYTRDDPCTIFTVVKRTAGSRVHFSMGDDNGWAVTTNGGTGVYGALFGGLTWIDAGASTTAWVRHTFTYVGNAAGTKTYVVYRDGTSVGTGTNSASVMSGSFWAGGDPSGTQSLHFAEVLIYKRVLNSTERGQVDTYLSAKWGI